VVVGDPVVAYLYGCPGISIRDLDATTVLLDSVVGYDEVVLWQITCQPNLTVSDEEPIYDRSEAGGDTPRRGRRLHIGPTPEVHI